MTPIPEAPGTLRVVSAADQPLPPAPEPGAPTLGDEPITVRLSHPIQAHGETVTSLTIRPPTIEEMEALDTIRNLDTTKFIKLLVLLAGIPRSSVLQLRPRDFNACANRLASAFFLPPDQTS
jgi:hypothetical protein